MYSPYISQDSNCTTCVLDSGVVTGCGAIAYSSHTCPISTVCGKQYYSYSDDSVSLNSALPSTFCVWNVDLSGSSSINTPLEISFSSGVIGVLLIEAYYVPTGISLINSSPSQYIVTEDNHKSFASLEIQNINYLIFIYYTDSFPNNYARVTISWSNGGGSSSTLSQILTITALCLVSVFCVGCCGVLCRRLYKSARTTSRVYDQVVSGYQRRARAYEALPENSVLSDEDIQRFFPRQLFKESLLEVGEKVCCICFEEYFLGRFNSNLFVRKLPCKHLFHAKCIEDWFVGRMLQPKCPLCKNNPFLVENVHESMNLERGNLRADNEAERNEEHSK